MGDLRGGLVDVGPMHGVPDFTFKMSECARALPAGGLPYRRVESARARPATVPARVGAGCGVPVA